MQFLIYEQDVNIMSIKADNEEDAIRIASERLGCTSKAPLWAIPDQLTNTITDLKARLRRM